MSVSAHGLRVRPSGFWRRLIAVVLANAVAVQALLIALGGFPLAANAEQSAPAFELCLHDTSGAPALPADKPGLPGCTHCIFCFAGAHHAVIGTAPAVFHRVIVTMVMVRRLGGASCPERPTRYTISGPRGPPLSA